MFTLPVCFLSGAPRPLKKIWDAPLHHKYVWKYLWFCKFQIWKSGQTLLTGNEDFNPIEKSRRTMEVKRIYGRYKENWKALNRSRSNIKWNLTNSLYLYGLKLLSQGDSWMWLSIRNQLQKTIIYRDLCIRHFDNKTTPIIRLSLRTITQNTCYHWVCLMDPWFLRSTCLLGDIK